MNQLDRWRVIEECQAAFSAVFLQGFRKIKPQHFSYQLSELTWDEDVAITMDEINAVLESLKKHPLDTVKEIK